MINYFKFYQDTPNHLSVGAVVLNADNQVLCHHFDAILGLQDVTILMRETLEPNETIEHALNRGLLEEFGATAEVVTYLGGLVAENVDFDMRGQVGQKTTVYCLMRLKDLDPSRRHGDIESTSQILWYDLLPLIELQKTQGQRLGRQDVDESRVLQWAQDYLNKSG